MFKWSTFGKYRIFHLTYSPINLPIAEIDWDILDTLICEEKENTVLSERFGRAADRYIEKRIKENV